MCDMCRGIGSKKYKKWARERLARNCVPLPYLEWLKYNKNSIFDD